MLPTCISMVNEDYLLQWQVVIIIGASASAVDISRDIASTAKEVHIADRSAPVRTCEKQPGYNNLWLHSMVNSLFSWWVKQDAVAFIYWGAATLVLLKLMLKLQIDRAEEDGSVVFQDGSSIKADVIMHCTGYRDLQCPCNIVSYLTKASHLVLLCLKLIMCFLYFNVC